MNKITIGIFIVVLGLVAGACSVDVERNADGSLQVETVITEESLQQEITAAIDDPLVREFSVEMKDGYALVDAVGDKAVGEGTNEVSFRLELSVVDGHLGADISDAVFNGFPVPAEIVAVWNDKLARDLERAGRRNPDNTLVGVRLTETELTMEWHVETPQSR